MVTPIREPSAVRPPRTRSKVSNGSRLFIEPVDGRTATGRRYRDLIYTFTSDLGGYDMLSENQLQLARRNALISSLCEGIEAQAVQERQIDVSAYVVLVNCQRRLCETLGLRRVARTVPNGVLEHFANHHNGAAHNVPESGTKRATEPTEATE